MPSNEIHDLVIVGSGPAGLSAAVGAESEHIDTLVLDRKRRLGGQAGTSSLIENFPGFPDGVTGPELTSLMTDQALKFDTEFMAPVQIEGIESVNGLIALDSETGRFTGRAALLGCGVEYRPLRVRNLAAYLGRGVTYGSPNMNTVFEDRKIYVVGGANSAGQAAVHLSQYTDCTVEMLVRGQDPAEKMSGYLLDKIKERGNISVRTETEVVGVNGNKCLKELTLKTRGTEDTVPADELFILIGADPRTKWLPEDVVRDKLGFVVAGNNLPGETIEEFLEKHKRTPFAHETSRAGLFVAGDIRSGSIKRVASAVGDGMGVVPEIHQYLALGRN
jgi:thioredoxin reductase (NADPH)